ncbi:MAG: hypothetical protein KAS48_07085 [Gammaproteobacteria bacterium]|nr:hypothetical protein [Gammaproteobacteria bacterium]
MPIQGQLLCYVHEIKINTSQHPAQGVSDITPPPQEFEQWIEEKEIENEKEEET